MEQDEFVEIKLDIDSVEFNEKIHSNAALLIDELGRENPGLLKQYPIESYTSLLNRMPLYKSSPFHFPKLYKILEMIKSQYGEVACERYQQLVLTELMKTHQTFAEYQARYTIEIATYFKNSLNRILSFTSLDNPLLYSKKFDKFEKDTLVCMHRYIPIGAVGAILTTFPLRWMFKNGVHSLLKGLSHLLRFGYNRPIIVIHAFSHDYDSLAKFTESGWKETYANLASIVIKNPKISGLVTGGWLFDPIFETISPNLQYLTKYMVEHGGTLYRGDVCTGKVLQDALFMAPKRRKLYEQGKYIPRVFRIYMSRENLISLQDLRQ